jgi:hypothetical protein
MECVTGLDAIRVLSLTSTVGGAGGTFTSFANREGI